MQFDYIQLAAIRGNCENNKNNMLIDDFYTLCQKNPKNNIGLRKFTSRTIILKKSNIDYLCSDFVRFCLSLYKNKSDLNAGELKIIPKEPIPISEELKEYIEEFLPDYYDIRTN